MGLVCWLPVAPVTPTLWKGSLNCSLVCNQLVKLIFSLKITDDTDNATPILFALEQWKLVLLSDWGLILEAGNQLIIWRMGILAEKWLNILNVKEKGRDYLIDLTGFLLKIADDNNNATPILFAHEQGVISFTEWPRLNNGSMKETWNLTDGNSKKEIAQGVEC